jgi:hypothetical protein
MNRAVQNSMDQQPGSAGPSSDGATWVPAVAGVAYAAVWAIGLSVWPANLSVNAPAAAVVTAYRGHLTQATVQLLLVEGVAGVLLGVVLISAGRSLGASWSARHSTPVLVAGIAAGAGAAFVSGTQCGLGLVSVATARAGSAPATGALFRLVDHLDGVKMLLIAGSAVSLAASMRPSGRWPRWLVGTALALAASLVFSAAAYLFLLQDISWSVYVSGPLLLIWVTATGLRVSTNARGRSQTSTGFDRTPPSRGAR